MRSIARATGVAVMRAVTQLGATPQEVAETLHAGGFLGARTLGTECPVARYLSDQFPEEAPVCVAVDLHEIVVATQSSTVRWIAPAVAEFVVDFDSGRFPDLIDPTVRDIPTDLGVHDPKIGLVPLAR